MMNIFYIAQSSTGNGQFSPSDFSAGLSQMQSWLPTQFFEFIFLLSAVALIAQLFK